MSNKNNINIISQKILKQDSLMTLDNEYEYINMSGKLADIENKEFLQHIFGHCH